MSDDVMAFFDTSAISASAATHGTDPHVGDEVDTLIKQASGLPYHFKQEHKHPSKRIRFHYRLTNDSQAKISFDSILVMYRQHVMHVNSQLLITFPFLDDYFRANPLGHKQYPDSDTNMFKNAYKLSNAKNLREHELQAMAYKPAEAPLTLSPTASVTDKPQTVADGPLLKKKRPSKKKRKSKQKQPVPRAPVATAHPDTATIDLAGPDPLAPGLRVNTDFANVLGKLQRELYVILRSNIQRFMDATCNGIIESRIATYEQTNNLVNHERLDISKRYSWSTLKEDTYVLCCTLATGGYYFLPFYTTLRGHNQIITKWCSVIQTIHKHLVEYDAGWGELSQVDAMKRLHSFLSKKEVEVIEKELQSNHREVWDENHKSIREFFTRNTLSKAITLINGIDTSKFPLKYDPLKHTPQALKQSLYSYDDLQAMKNTKSNASALNAMREQLTKCQQELSKERKRKRLKVDNGNKDGRKPRKARAEDDPELEKLVQTLPLSVRSLMGKNKNNQRPCLDCAKVGLRLFHANCDKALQTKAIANKGKRERDKGVKPPAAFPPLEKDRKNPFATYSDRACKHCKREDVDTKFANVHSSDTCYRRKGGECDVAGATSRNARSRIVRNLAQKRKRDRDTRTNTDGAPAQKAQRGGHKTTSMAVKQHAHENREGEKPTPEPLKETPASVERDPVLEKRNTKVRSRQYKRSELAIANPLTDDELSYLTSRCLPCVKKGHIIHQYEADNDKAVQRLTALRKTLKENPYRVEYTQPPVRKQPAPPQQPVPQHADTNQRDHRPRSPSRDTSDEYDPSSPTRDKDRRHSRSRSSDRRDRRRNTRDRRGSRDRRDRRRNSRDRRGSRDRDRHGRSHDRHRKSRGAKQNRNHNREPRRSNDRRSRGRHQPLIGHMPPELMPPSPPSPTRNGKQTTPTVKSSKQATAKAKAKPEEIAWGGFRPFNRALANAKPKAIAQQPNKKPHRNTPTLKKTVTSKMRPQKQSAIAAAQNKIPYNAGGYIDDPAMCSSDHSSRSEKWTTDEEGESISRGGNVRQHNGIVSTSHNTRFPNAWCNTYTRPIGHLQCQREIEESKALIAARSEQKEEEVVLEDLPMGPWLPARSIVSHKISMPNSTYSPFDVYTNKNKNKTLLSSETKGTRLLQAYMHYRDVNGITKLGRVKLDTQSNGCYSLPNISLPRKWRPWEPTLVKGIGGNLLPLGDPTYFTIIKNDEPIKIDSNTPNSGVFPDGCIALLGLDVIYNLGIDIAYAIGHEKHMPVKFLSDKSHLVTSRKQEAYAEYDKRGFTQSILHKTCNLSERVVKQYLDSHPDSYVQKPIDSESVDISPSLPRRIRELIMLLIKRYEDVFASTTNMLPPPLKGVEPHMFKMKEGFVHRMAPRPTFSPARGQLINEWLDWAISVGLVEEATNTSYASRLILAAKRKGNTPKSAPPDGIRVAWAGVDINEGITKTVPTYTDAWQQLYKVANLKYKFSADGLKQYWSIPLTKEAREITAFWTPRGLFQFTRMVMGTKNAATVAQNAYTKAMHTMLHQRSFPKIANFADDFLGGANTGESLIQVFEDFLNMCRKAKITLNPAKVRIGYEKEQFFGLSIENGRIEPAMRNIDPVVNMTYPKNRAELRSVMGVFNQFSSFIDDYGRSPSSVILNTLVSPKAEWEFTKHHRNALDTLKSQVQQDIHLYAPDYKLPLVLETDGSDDGWGAVLYQLVNDEKRIIKMWSKQWKTEAWHKKPPYHREAKAWMNGMTLALPYVMCSQFPLQCWTDHSPLTWVKHTSGKGPVSQFIVDTLSHIDYEMNYIKGEDNIIADGLSRFPMLGPQKLVRSGLANALDVLLATLLTEDLDTSKIWFDAKTDTKFLLPNIFDWCHARKKLNPLAHTPTKHCYQDSLSVSKLTKLKYTLGIWAPSADKISRQMREAFKQDKPFACLVPSDLIDRICVGHDGVVSEAVRQAVNTARKITFLTPNLTWVIHKIDINHQYQQVYVNHRITPELELNVLMEHLKNSNITPPLPTCTTRMDWIREQLRQRSAALWAHDPRVFLVQDGLLVYQPTEGETHRTIVPQALQKPLIKWQHHLMCHMTAGKIFNVLKKKFHFKHMHKICHEVVNDCALCNLLKARMKHAHKHFRAKLSIQPRTSYGADYYSVKKNKFGYNNILGIIDLSTGNLVLKAVQGRTAANTAHTLFYDIVVRKGVPLRFHSDAAKEFLSTAMSTLQTLLGISKSDTLAHNPKSNAKIERVWEFVGRALKAMPHEQYAFFHLYMPIISHVWNCTPDSDTKITPFEAEHGMTCRSVAESVLQAPPAEGLPASASDLKTIAVAAHGLNELISNIKAVERANTANKLNTYGQPMKDYVIGDQVAFYLPPNDKEAQRMGKNPKHMLQYQGPGTIVESLSTNNTAFKIKCNNRTYNRNIMHISPYSSTQRVPAELQLHIDNTVSVGSYVALLDKSTDMKYHIAKVLDVGEISTTLHYYASKGRRLREAIWRPLYAHPRSNVVVMEMPDTIIRNHLQYTGTIDTRPLGDSLIILPNIGMTDRNRINVRTRTILTSKVGYAHHRITTTWDPNHDN